MEWIPTENSFYYALNKILRNRNCEHLICPWLFYLRLFMTALSKLPSNSVNPVYRGVKMDLRDHYRVGSRIVWWGFSSCTPRIHVLENAPYFGTTDTRTLFLIQCDSGKNIKEHSLFHTEDDVVLAPGIELEVVSHHDSGNGLHVIHLKEVRHHFPHMPPVLPASQSTTIKNTSTASERMRHASPTREKAKTTSQLHSGSKQVDHNSEASTKTQRKFQNITDTDVHRVIDEVLIRKKATELDLSWSKITCEAVTILAKSLQKNQVNSITSLFFVILIDSND